MIRNWVLGAALLALVACAGGKSVDETVGDAGEAPPTSSDAGVARVDCSELLPGVLPDGRSEADPDFQAQLESMSFDALPEVLPAVSSDSQTGTAYYLLNLPREDAGIPLAAAQDAGVLGRVLMGAYAVKAADGSAGLDFLFLRKGLHRYYACATGQPRTLEDFARWAGDYAAWPSTTVTSRPKGGPRRLRSQGDVHIAETLDTDGGVRETEVILTNARNDGALTFWSYDHAGRATNVSTFASGTGAMNDSSSPFTCMACHFNAQPWRYDKLIP